MFKKTILILISTILAIGLAACKEDEKEKKEDKQDAKEEQPKEEKKEESAGTEKLGSLGITPEELTEIWNSVQTDMEDTGAYKIEKLQVSNGEFKTDLSEGLIMEGLVDEENKEITRLSMIRKEVEDETMEQSVNEFANTITAFYLLIAVTNKDEKLKEEEIGKVIDELGLLAEEKKEKIEGESTLNDVTYRVEENERGIVLTATEKKS